ncbi:MAG: ribose 5-phosphate isomerase B [Phycisphaeraceae bacterium]|nr:ribose 5-phosphate isomerase B [Phycisphaeraceae bacterium]
MKIAIGADHRGMEVRNHLSDWLKQQGYEVEFRGECNDKASDYPDAAHLVAKAVASGEVERGILICGTGIGMSIAANKVHGIRAALVHDEIGADLARRHNDANILCLSADMLGLRIIDRIVKTWLTTKFEGGRHARRILKVAAIEEGRDPALVNESELPAPPAEKADVVH